MQIEAIQDAKAVNVKVNGSGLNWAPINIELEVPTADIHTAEQLESALERYQSLGAEPHERPAWDFIRGMPNPVVIALDRSISAEAEGTLYSEPEARYFRPRTPRRVSPLTKVSEVTSNAYADYKRRMIDLDAELKARMVMSALLDPDPLMGSDRKGQISKRELEDLERRLTAYLSTALKGDDVRKQVRQFFSRTRTLGTTNISNRQREFLWSFYATQYRQLEDLLHAFHDFDRRSAAAYEGLQKYLDVINQFLRDSRKQALFNEATNNLGFQFLDNEQKPTSSFIGLENLSSGERQVLILFTFLAFVADTKKIFIVDEPELSLHPKWQSEFLNAFLKLKPRATQVLLATHSPDIVGQHKQACVVLLP
jgi:hypothetical protein